IGYLDRDRRGLRTTTGLGEAVPLLDDRVRVPRYLPDHRRRCCRGGGGGGGGARGGGRSRRGRGGWHGGGGGGRCCWRLPVGEGGGCRRCGRGLTRGGEAVDTAGSRRARSGGHVDVAIGIDVLALHPHPRLEPLGIADLEPVPRLVDAGDEDPVAVVDLASLRRCGAQVVRQATPADGGPGGAAKAQPTVNAAPHTGGYGT